MKRDFSHSHGITADGRASDPGPRCPSIVSSLTELTARQAKIRTIYAVPPWPYSNTAARGAAENHARTMSFHEICNVPVKELVTENAHLHLCATNAFRCEAFEVIRTLSVGYKYCLFWVKPQPGMGNYWRVSHEYFLPGIRRDLPFRSNKVRSWQSARRTAQSRMPFLFRGLIEQVSPGPHLELDGREERPNSEWTVRGTQMERRLF